MLGGGRGGGQFEDAEAGFAGGLKRGSSGSSKCRTIPPETVHGASVTLANFENLGKANTYLTQFSISRIWLSLDFMAIYILFF